MFSAAVMLTVAVLALASAITPGAADELRTMTYDPATSDNECVGNPVSPPCAIDTLVACEVRTDDSVCRSIGYRPNGHILQGGPTELAAYKYRVTTETLSADNIPEWAREGNRCSRINWPCWYSGDLAVDVWFHYCRPNDTCLDASENDPKRSYGEGCVIDTCHETSFPKTYIFRQDDQLLGFVDNYDPAVPGTRNRYWERK